MYTLIVHKIGSAKSAEVQASHRQILIDHLEAVTQRNGFGVTWNEPGVRGDLLRDGQIVGTWEISTYVAPPEGYASWTDYNNGVFA